MSIEQEVVELRAENAQLKRQLSEALARISELEKLKTPPAPFIKPDKAKSEANSKKPRCKRDPKTNHARKLEKPTQIITLASEQCPECNYQLRGQSIARRRQVIEVPSTPMVEIREYQVVKRWCPKCEKWREPKLDLSGQVLGKHRLGLKIMSLVAYLRTNLRLTIRQVVSYLKSLHGLWLSTGEVVEVLHAVRKAGQVELDQLQAAARASPVLHADETGWRQNGHNGYIWALITPGSGAGAVRYYHYDRRRESLVIKGLLGPQFKGHLVTDFYSGYNIYEGRHQRCWVHLLRDLHQLKELHPGDAAVQDWAGRLRELYDEAAEFIKRGTEERVGPELEQWEREIKYKELVASSHALGLEYAQLKAHACQALAKRLLRHEDELFQYVRVAGLSPDNNAAERGVRPLVVVRKISGGSRSEKGSKTRMGLASLFETWQARGLEPLAECQRLLGIAVGIKTPLPQL